MAYRYPTLDELAASDAEREAAKTSAGAQQQGTAWGSGIGSVLGGAAGLLPLLAGPAGAALLPMTVPLGATLGGGLGGAIGGSVGEAQANAADEALSGPELERAKKLQAIKDREEALAALEAVR